MKRFIPWLWIAMTFAAACTAGPQSGGVSQVSTPAATEAVGTGDPLPSWNDGTHKKCDP